MRAHRQGWWVVSALILLASALLVWRTPFAPADRFTYDQFVRLSPYQLDEAIVIVAIDDDSLARIGRWPWARSIEAATIDRIAAGKPRAIGIDILFEEGDSADTDRALADAIRRSGRVVLPLVSEGGPGRGWYPGLPIQSLIDAAAGLGHVNLELDSDGLARYVFLEEGVAGHRWNHFDIAMLRVGGDPLPNLPGERNVARTAPTGSWIRNYRLAIPFSGPPGNATTVSLAKVLSGEIPSSFFHDKYVLIGATAQGIGDQFPTPVSAGSRPMSGVEISANLLDGLLHQRWVDDGSLLARLFFALTPIAFVLLALRWLGPREALATIGGMALAVLFASYVSWYVGRIWLPPATTVAVLIAIYPIWSWRRIETAIQFMRSEVSRMNDDFALAPLTKHSGGGDVLDQRIRAMRESTQFLRELHRFAVDNFNNLLDAALIVDRKGNIQQANPAALELFGDLRLDDIVGHSLFSLMGRLSAPGMPVIAEFLAIEHAETREFEATTRLGRDLLVKFATRNDARGENVGLIVSLVNISRIRDAERRRDEALRFISHDIRSPQSAILASLYMLEEGAEGIDRDDTFTRIRQNAHHTIRLADEFVLLSQAESADYAFEEIEINSLLLDAADLQWDLARKRKITLAMRVQEAPAFVHANRDLLTRALGNLINNAIKYGRPGSSVTCAIVEDGSGCRIEIQDGGPGIPESEAQFLFQRFRRLSSAIATGELGAGLGLSFVKIVFERHGGSVWLKSSTPEGSTFAAYLPYAQAPRPDDLDDFDH